MRIFPSLLRALDNKNMKKVLQNYKLYILPIAHLNRIGKIGRVFDYDVAMSQMDYDAAS
jgi:hypothetical protein